MSIQNTCHDRTISCIESLFFVYSTYYIVQQYYNRTFIIYIYIYIYISLYNYLYIYLIIYIFFKLLFINQLMKLFEILFL